MSYRFYDPIIQLAQNQTSRTVKDYFALIQSLHVQRIEDEKASGTINVDQTEIYEDFTYYLDATKKLKDE